MARRTPGPPRLNMVANPYLQFPLCTLAYGRTVEERLNAILDYSVVEAGPQLFRKLTGEHQGEFVVRRQQIGKLPEGIKLNEWLHQAVLYGAEIIGITYNDFGSIMKRHQALRVHITDFEKLHGRDAKVRIKKGWLFET